MISLVVAISGLLIGCSRKSSDASLLTNASDSPEEACQRVLNALARSDADEMHELRITRFEHDSVLVPNMPIGRSDPSTTDLGYAWFLLEQNNQKGVRRAMEDYGGIRLRVVSVEFKKPVQIYGPVRLHKGTEVIVEDPTGAQFSIPIFGSVIEHGGKYKVVSIRD